VDVCKPLPEVSFNDMVPSTVKTHDKSSMFLEQGDKI